MMLLHDTPAPSPHDVSVARKYQPPSAFCSALNRVAPLASVAVTVGLSIANATPLSVTVCGEFEALVAIVSVALRLPAAAGAKLKGFERVSVAGS